MNPDSESEKFFTIVALLSEHIPLPESELIHSLDRVTGDKFSQEVPGHFFSAVLPELQYLVFIDGHGVTIHNYEQQYFDGDEVGACISDLGLAEAVKTHAGWMSVDWTYGEVEDARKWNTIGNVLAQLPLQNCTGFFIPEMGTVLPMHEGIRTALASSDVIQELGF